MKERDRFGNEMRALGIYPADFRSAREAPNRPGVVDSELYQPDPGGGSGTTSTTTTPPRLSKGALGEAFADFQDAVGVPSNAIVKLTASEAFRNLMVKDIDKTYTALKTLMDAGQPPDLNAEGRLSKGRFKNRRVLSVFSSAVCDFHRAQHAEHSGSADVVECAAPPATADAKFFEQQWIIRILFMVALVHSEAIAKRKKSGPLVPRIKAWINEQVAARRLVDNVLRDIDQRDAGFKIGIAFGGLTGRDVIERSYYPMDFLIPGLFVLTNLEHYALLECMDEARRQMNVKPEAVDQLKSEADAKTVAGTVEEIGAELDSMKPLLFTKQGGNFVPSGFGRFYFARRLIHRRWQMLDPSDVRHSDWKTDQEIVDMQKAHAAVIFPPGLKYA